MSKRPWANHFQIQSEVNLDFVISQGIGWPVGMTRASPPEFRRRILAASISYQLQLRSIDYALKRYVERNLYEDEPASLGDEVSDYLRRSNATLSQELHKLHTPEPVFGVFGAELTLYRIVHSLDVARMLANRGLLLEVLPILRLCQEMMAWATVAFRMESEKGVVDLKAQTCISAMKRFYPTAGKLYGYLSKFSHWGHVVHGEFISIDDQQVSVLNASVRYRAMALSLCLVILDVLVDVVGEIYAERSEALVVGIQGVRTGDVSRKTAQMLFKSSEMIASEDVREICALLRPT